MDIRNITTSLDSVRSGVVPRQDVATPISKVTEILNRIEARRELRMALRLRDDVLDLKQALTFGASLAPSGSTIATTTVTSNPSARSSAPIGLNTSETYTTLVSSSTITADTTSYAPTAPVWNGASTANPSFTGSYNGDQGSGTLTFEVSRAGTIGDVHTRIDVLDPNGDSIERINLNRNNPVGQLYELSNGLTVQFSAGDLVSNDTFELSVFSAADLQPDPDAAFDGSSGSYPRFEAGLSVAAGSFTVNGVTIFISADDTINSVLSNITASSANVEASYNTTAEKIELSQKSLGGEHTIVLADDSSGFLAATKLLTAVAEPGTTSELDQPMNQVGVLSGVLSGSVIVNGQTVSIDPNNDSLQTVLDNISQQLPNVSASYTQNGEVVLESESAFALVLNSNGTGLFEALGIASGTYNPSVTEVQTAGQSTGAQRTGATLNDILLRTTKITRQLTALFKNPLVASERIGLFRTEIDSIFSSKEGQKLDALGIGSRKRFLSSAQGYRISIDVQPQTLFRNLVQQYDSVFSALMTPSSLAESTLDRLQESIEATLLGRLKRGSLIDTYV